MDRFEKMCVIAMVIASIGLAISMFCESGDKTNNFYRSMVQTRVQQNSMVIEKDGHLFIRFHEKCYVHHPDCPCGKK